MTFSEAADILDPQTTREALQKYGDDDAVILSVVNEACTIAANELRKMDDNACQTKG